MRLIARKTKDELNALMKQEGVDRIWSWSKWNCFHTSPFEYYLKYIKRMKEDRTDCIYATTGGIAHDILERFYTDTIIYSDMIDEFNDGWITAFDIANLKFDRNSEEKNDKISQKYYENLHHFFSNHTPLVAKLLIEQFVTVKIGGNLFQGYIDVCYRDEEGYYTIADWKTSTIYTGKKALDECGQLVVYAMGLMQKGIPLDKIRICWNFLKYTTIQYQQANGTKNSRNVERYKIGESLQSNAKMWLKKLGYTDEMDDYLKALLDSNDIKCLPEEVQEKYTISDCYVYVPLTEKLIQDWKEKIIAGIEDIKLREQDYEETGNDKAFWDTDDSVKAQSYYFSTLCGYSPNLHLPYKAYLDRLEAKSKGEDLFGGVGEGVQSIDSKADSCDLSWLDDVA